jgi:hypothetical protein
MVRNEYPAMPSRSLWSLAMVTWVDPGREEFMMGGRSSYMRCDVTVHSP